MGACFSYNWNDISDPKKERLAARVIWKSGEVREYAAAVTVEEVLSDHKNSQKIGEDEPHFVCNSDSLYFDQLIPALNSDHQLNPNEIYFVLEASQGQRPLSAADMASLAHKATAALDVDGKKKKKKRFARVSPQHHHDIDECFSSHPPVNYDSDRTIGKARGGGANNNNDNNNSKLPRSTSSSMKKLQRLTSRRAKLAVRSFRLRLSTIYEST